jgi:glutaredoxin/glutathione-dependent peroxiredoxin
MIQIGDRIPDATLFESTEFGESCPVSPGRVSVAEATRGRRIVLFDLPGAYTSTCSTKHVPGYVRLHTDLRAKRIDEIWCVSVNDGYVMAAWGREQKALGKTRMLGDGNAELTKKLGLERDLTDTGMGLRSRRYSMLIEDGVVKHLHVEAPGKFEVSDAETMLEELG